MKPISTILGLLVLLANIISTSCFGYSFAPNHIYKIVNRESGRTMEVGRGGNPNDAGKPADGWYYTGEAKMQWQIVNQSSDPAGPYRIINYESKKFLSDRAFSTYNQPGTINCKSGYGVLVQDDQFSSAYPVGPGATQDWYIFDAPGSSGGYTISSYDNCTRNQINITDIMHPPGFSSSDDNHYYYRTAELSANSVIFDIIDVSPNYNNNYTSSVFQIINNYTGKALTVEPNDLNDRSVKQLTAWGLAAEEWTITPATNGYYSIVSRRNGLILEIGGGATNNGATANVWENYVYDGQHPWQEWAFLDPNTSRTLSIQEFTDGRNFVIYCHNAGKVLQFASGNNNNETPATIWNTVGQSWQVWHMQFTANNAKPKPILADDPSPSVAQPSQDEGLHNLVLYPNPASNTIIIRAPNHANTSSYKISITDMRGSTVMTTASDGQFDVSALASGIYTVSIKDDKGVYHQKFVKN